MKHTRPFADDLRHSARPLARLFGSMSSSSALGAFGIGRAWGLPPEDMDYHYAYRLIPTVQFCVALYQTTIAATPLKFYVGQGDTKTEIERKPGNVVDLWNRGNTEESGMMLLQQLVGSRQLQGVAYLFKDYSDGIARRGTPQQFWCLNPLLVTPIKARNGRGVVEYRVRDGNEFRTVPRQQIVAFRRYDPDLGLDGVSRVGALRLAYETQRDAARFMRSFYKRGGTIAGHYSTDQAMDVDEIEALKKDLHERVQGPENAWEPVILPRKLQFVRAGLTFAEMQFIESEKMTTEQMLRLFVIHPILASQNVSAGLNSDVANTAMMMFLRFGAMPEAREVADVLNERLLSTGEFGPNISCEFDFSNDPVLVDAWLKQAEAWAKATGGYPATRAEARDKLGLPDRTVEFPTLDEPLVPIGVTTEGDFATQDVQPAAPVPDPNAPATDPATDPVPPDVAEVRARRNGRDALKRRGSKLLSIQERKVRAETLRMLRRQVARVKAKLREQEGKGRSEARAVDLNELLHTLEAPEDRQRVRRLMRAIVQDRGEQAIAELAQELAFDMSAKAVAEFIAEKSAKYITNVNGTTRTALRGALEEGVAANETLGELIGRVDDVFKGRRGNAETIARTETAPAYNFATRAAWAQSGVVTAKQWLTAHDDAVRPEHAAVDGQEVPLDGAFVVGGDSLDYPGDPSGDAGNVINCRCTMVPVVREDGKARLPKRIADRLRPAVNGHGRALTVEEWLNATGNEEHAAPHGDAGREQ